MSTDLFDRLAQRALSEATPSLRAEPEPDPGPWDDEPAIAVVEPEVTTEPVAATGVPPSPHRLPSPLTGDPLPRGPAVRDAPARSEIVRLVPIPAIIPPTPGTPAPAAAADAGRVPTMDRRTTTNPPTSTDPERPGVVDRPRSVSDRGVPPTPVLRPAPPTAAPPAAPIAPRVDPQVSPAVEVTVGRLEIRVRAPSAGERTAAKQPDRGPAPAPELTLEDYLRSRETPP
jgi:hypothetical protein